MTWNRCDECGKFIPYRDFENGAARHELLLPDSEFSIETYGTLCKDHNRREPEE